MNFGCEKKKKIAIQWKRCIDWRTMRSEHKRVQVLIEHYETDCELGNCRRKKKDLPFLFPASNQDQKHKIFNQNLYSENQLRQKWMSFRVRARSQKKARISTIDRLLFAFVGRVAANQFNAENTFSPLKTCSAVVFVCRKHAKFYDKQPETNGIAKSRTHTQSRQQWNASWKYCRIYSCKIFRRGKVRACEKETHLVHTEWNKMRVYNKKKKKENNVGKTQSSTDTRPRKCCPMKNCCRRAIMSFR